MADKKPLSKNLLGLLISAGVVFLAPVLGLLSTVLFLRGAFRDTASVDPSEKARFLAEGISAAMNTTAFGLVISIVALVPAVAFGVRLWREGKRRTPSADGER